MPSRLLITSSVCVVRENGKGCGIPLFPCLRPVIPAKSVFLRHYRRSGVRSHYWFPYSGWVEAC